MSGLFIYFLVYFLFKLFVDTFSIQKRLSTASPDLQISESSEVDELDEIVESFKRKNSSGRHTTSPIQKKSPTHDTKTTRPASTSAFTSYKK